MKTTCRILIVDDHPIFRHGLIRLLQEQKDLVVCAEAVDAAQAIREAGRARPDIAILDISLPESNGIELCQMLRHQLPRLKVVMVSMHKDSLYAERATRAGASGYVLKQEAPDKLIEALRVVFRGGQYFSPSFTPVSAPQGGGDITQLSDRELQVFQMIGAGRSTRAIAADLGLSIKTIESYRAHIKVKMGLESGYALVQSAIYWHHFEAQPR